MNVRKTEIREMMRARRKALSADERARAAAIVCDKLTASLERDALLDSFAGPGLVCAVYLASADEIDLTDAVVAFLKRGVMVVAPRWNGVAYELAKLKSLDADDLRRGPMGILEPKDADVVQPKEVAVWLVPGLAFTADGGRLGYGGGWYDRLMAGAHRDARKLGIAYGFQVVADLPSERHDIPLTAVVDDSIENGLASPDSSP